MDSYIIRIYRRGTKNHPLAGTIEPVGNDLDSFPFNDRDQLWTLLSLPDKSDKAGPKINQTGQK